MRGMNSNSVDLIYLDPPFNSNRNYAAPIGSEAADAEFKDTWSLTDIDNEWINLIADKHPKLHRVLLATMADSDKSYLVYMAVRLLEMKRILKDTGSIYLHCDPTMSHYLKLMMDAVFGRENFRNDIIWCYTGPQRANIHYPRKHDNILFYSLNGATFNKDAIRVESKWNELGGFSKEGVKKVNKGKVPEDWWHMTFGPNTRERTGYPTQKPLALLDRIIKASSNEGDIVFDPFCGCATTLASADGLRRDWIGIDISPMATKLVRDRIRGQQGLYLKIVSRDDIPQRTDMGKLPQPKTYRKNLFGEQEGKCNGCGHRFNIENFDVDHIIAKSKGGTDHIENLQLLCGYCNSTKGDRGMEYLIQRLKLDNKALGIKRLDEKSTHGV